MDGKANPCFDGKKDADKETKTDPPCSQRPRMQPDGPWSWVVAVACSCMNLFSVAMIRAAGVVYVNLVEYFNVSRQEAAWPISAVPASANLIGPFVAILVRRFGIRPVAITGTFMSSVAVMLCFFAPNVLYLTIFLGVFHGMGTGMTMTPNAVCLNEWFDEKKVRASGIIYAGATVGSFIFPVLFKHCSDVYGTRGCFLIFGALMMHGMVSSLFVRSPPWVEKAKRHKAHAKLLSKLPEVKIDQNTAPIPLNGKSSHLGKDNKGFEVDTGGKTRVQQEVTSNGQNSNVEKHIVQEQHMISSLAVIQLPSEMNSEVTVEINSSHCCQLPKTTLKRSVSHDADDPVPHIVCENKNSFSSSVMEITKMHALQRATSNASHVSSTARCRVRRTSSTASSISNFYAIAEPAGLSNAISSIPEAESIEDPESEAHVTSQESAPEQEDKKRLLSVAFFMVALTYIFVTNSNMLFMTVIMDFAHDRGVELDKAVYLLSGFATADIAGRLSCGWVADTGLLAKKTIVGLCCTIFGVVMQVTPLCTDYLGLMCACISIGYAIGNSVVLFAVLLADGVGVQRIPTAMGLMTFFSGLTAFGRPALIGYFRDNIGSYDNMLRAVGLVVLVIGLTWLLLRFLERTRSRSFNLRT
ncbi:uncharacterized protein LOC144145355 isoform X1 [Haemaphysalis longicornis]